MFSTAEELCRPQHGLCWTCTQGSYLASAVDCLGWHFIFRISRKRNHSWQDWRCMRPTSTMTAMTVFTLAVGWSPFVPATPKSLSYPQFLYARSLFLLLVGFAKCPVVPLKQSPLSLPGSTPVPIILDCGIVTRQLSQLPFSPAVTSSESLNL